MSSPQLKNGYTPVANEIMEALWKVNLYPYESRIIWFILRKTYGWKKKTDWITLNQFSKEIGLDKRLIHRTLKKLADRNIIIIYRDDKNLIRYGFQKNYERWKASSKKMTKIKSVINKDDETSSFEIPTKETNTKKINNGEPLVPTKKNGKSIVIYFADYYNFLFNKSYPINFSKNASQAKILYKKIGDEIFPTIRHFLCIEANEHYYWSTREKTIDIFIHFIDKIIDHMREYL